MINIQKAFKRKSKSGKVAVLGRKRENTEVITVIQAVGDKIFLPDRRLLQVYVFIESMLRSWGGQRSSPGNSAVELCFCTALFEEKVLAGSGWRA